MREDPTFDTIRMLNGFKPFLRHHYSSINTSCGDGDFGMIAAEFFPRNPEVKYYRMSFSSVMRLGCWLARREILFRDFNGICSVPQPHHDEKWNYAFGDPLTHKAWSKRIKRLFEEK
jgi:hypothetical protein